MPAAIRSPGRWKGAADRGVRLRWFENGWSLSRFFWGWFWRTGFDGYLSHVGYRGSTAVNHDLKSDGSIKSSPPRKDFARSLWNLGFGIWNLETVFFELGTWNLDFGIWNLEFAILELGNSEFGIWNFGTWKLIFGSWNLEFEFWTLEFEIWNLKFITNYTIFYIHASHIEKFFFFIFLQ